MAKRKRRSTRKASPPPPRPPSAAAARQPLPEARVTRGADPEPAFWFGFEVSWAKLVTCRVVVFGLLALDALLQIRHAPRYGATTFNVAHVGFLDELGPGRIGYGAGQLVLAYLLALVAFGVGTRLALPIAAALYGWLYFGSQLDSYQHHYLVAVVLVIACGVPWARPTGEVTPGTPVRSWALRLVLVELAIVYFWAAVSKLDPAWVDGRTLASQLSGVTRAIAESTIGFAATAVLVLVTELALAATIWLRPAWRVAAPLGIALHLAIVATGFEIGLFAFLMFGLYLLVLPDRWFVWAADTAPLAWLRRTIAQITSRDGWRPLAIAVVVAALAALLVRFPDAAVVAIVAGVVPLVLGVHALTRGGAPRGAIAAAHVAAILAWIVVDHATTVAFDYYRFWGGSQRRLGNLELAERAYRGAVEVEPDDPNANFQLGRLELALGDEAGLDHLHAAQRLEPARARAWNEEARYLARRGRIAAAIEAARGGVAADARDRAARALLDALTAARPVAPTDEDDARDEPRDDR